MSEMLLVGSKTKAALKANGVNVGAGALEALNEVVHWYIGQAAGRAAANRRKTVRGHDFAVIDAEKAAGAPAPVEAPAPPPSDSFGGGDGGFGGGGDEGGGDAAAEKPTSNW